MAQILEQLTQVLSDETKAHEIGLRDAIKMEMVTVDTTCLEVNIHFPVDWILLRDAVRTLMKATATIRKHGLKKRSKVESCISILKHVFLWNTPKAKGYEHRAMQVTWAVFAHNLWIMARRGRWKEDELAPLAA